MSRGRLRVFLGAAPGVGKTYAMLEEGHRLRGMGKDVVVAFVETHERAATAALLNGLELTPRRTVSHRGVALTEMDLPAVLARQPRIALVDELAHTNAPGSHHDKRWQDVAALLDAGIDVISTVNIQHIESLNDVVQQITGIVQRETIPDQVLRAADQTELVDLTPQALRDRLAAGSVYPAARIDAALSNYFRVGNLTALRELALLWLADEVDSALQRYRAEHGISNRWEARERVVVALTGGPEGETLLRRGARIAARSVGGELLALHVTSDDGLQGADPAVLAKQRALVEQLGGTFHEIVGADIPSSLVTFARSQNATQLVIGVSRRSRLASLLTGPGTGQAVVRASGDIDVHIVTHAAAGRGRLALPRNRGALTARRRIAGFALALVVGPLLTLLLFTFRSNDALAADVLAFQLLVVIVALVGGSLPATFAAILSGLTLDYLFVAPLFTITISRPLHLVALLLYLANGLLVSFVVDQAARRFRAATRSAAEAEVLATIAGGVIRGSDTLQSLVEQTRESFGLGRVELKRRDVVLAGAGDAGGAVSASLPVADDTVLELTGPSLSAADQRILTVVTTQIRAALEHTALATRAEELQPLEATDRVRSALLAAVGHDLRRPLAVATAAVTSLRSPALRLSDHDRVELLSSAEGALTNLAELITNLLDVSRVQAGALAVSLDDVDVGELIPTVIEELQLAPGDLEVHIPEDLPQVRADALLLQRAIVNIVANAQRYSPPGAPPRLSASTFDDQVQIRVADSGPGVSEEQRQTMFQPFQRSGDTDNTTGIGLGLALSQGFVQGMGGSLDPEDTPGGGLTMVITVPTAHPASPPREPELEPEAAAQ